MMTLVVPDVHERLDRLAIIMSRIAPRADRVVFLGDFFDTFDKYDEARVVDACAFINNAVNDERHDVLLGNHDVHYYFSHPNLKCSGYDERKTVIIKALIEPATIHKMQLYTIVGPYTVSHAGFTKGTIGYASTPSERMAIEVGLAGSYDPIFGAGRARGGSLQFGGPTWLDWSDEFVCVPGTPQIVGHTYLPRPASKQLNGEEFRSWNIDTALRYVAMVNEDNGEVLIEDVPLQ